MTGQQLDVLHNNGQDYAIVEFEGGDGYIYKPPETISICSISTACAIGYLCRYEVSTVNGNLILRSFRVRTDDSVYPRIEGVDPVDQGISFTSSLERVCTLWADYVGMNVHVTRFTGRIMLGADYLRGSYDHLHSGATCYKNVWEIDVQQGRVVKAVDVSGEVAARRLKNEQRHVHDDYHFYSWEHDMFLKQMEQKRLAGEVYSGDEDDL
ncbi:hypothetical protein FRACYDRAFT_256534 [Fragilariopsis cylindrus CCMP1102]|uniref:Uncharacterized protein n=1 Tax=Fragilariopsis cylindrus CCMP1102 TaxID=635003 RepID=A0A1E7EJN9_9STRA|nr:hypothetical protein FRACYDRAFT_256534 [Fragilariopsis cylindrus CCMP1102]|eukprot:OEU06105.1 hypothetical protein FRACYDRAFT_256534 [Fragilariopsis cylindrus CCMP1102]